MGRIVFDSRSFKPETIRARLKTKGRSGLRDAWMSPQGVVAAATLAQMLGGLRLPEGLRDQGVDAEAQALKFAAQKRVEAKSAIERKETDARAIREGSLEAPETKEGAVQADALRMTAQRGFDPRMVEARVDSLIKEGKHDDAMSLLRSAGMPANRFDLHQRGLTPTQRGGRISERRDALTDPGPTQAADADQALRDELAIRQAGGSPELMAALAVDGVAPKEPRRETRDPVGRTDEQVLARSLEAADLMVNAYKTDEQIAAEAKEAEAPAAGSGLWTGIGITPDDLKGDGSDRVKSMSREDLRYIMQRWKEGAKRTAQNAALREDLDMAEVNAMEELIHRQMRKKASEEAGVQGISRLMTEEQLSVLTEESAAAFMAEKRAEDPYFGMAPEEALRQIYIDAPTKKTEEDQARHRQLAAHYTPRYQTFSDLFFGDPNAKLLGSVGAVNRLFPDPKEALTELQRLQAAEQVLRLEDLASLPKDLRPIRLKAKKDVAEINRLRQVALNAANAGRKGNKKGTISAIAEMRKSLKLQLDAKYGLSGMKAKLQQVAKARGDDDSVRAQLLVNVSAKDLKQSLSGANLSKETRDALDVYIQALARRDADFLERDNALLRASVAYKRGEIDVGEALVKEEIKALGEASKKIHMNFGNDAAGKLTDFTGEGTLRVRSPEGG